MKILYAGTPEFAVLPLKKLIENGYEVVGVVTQEDKPQGRKAVLTPSPVKVFALENGLPVFQPHKIREEVEYLRSFNADVMITCAYGQILNQDVLDSFSYGVWNIHAGLLPYYRGASPIQSCILNGETETGVCIMKTELGLDTGDVLICEKTEIGDLESYGELSKRLSVIGADALMKAVSMIESGNYELKKQGEENACVYKKIDKDAGKLDFSADMKTIINTVRAYDPEPTAYAYLDGVRLNIFRVEKAEIPEEFTGEKTENGEVLCDVPKKGFIVKCSDGAIKITELQAPGGKRMKGADFLNGRKAKKGQVLC